MVYMEDTMQWWFDKLSTKSAIWQCIETQYSKFFVNLVVTFDDKTIYNLMKNVSTETCIQRRADLLEITKQFKGGVLLGVADYLIVVLLFELVSYARNELSFSLSSWSSEELDMAAFWFARHRMFTRCREMECRWRLNYELKYNDHFNIVHRKEMGIIKRHKNLTLVRERIWGHIGGTLGVAFLKSLEIEYEIIDNKFFVKYWSPENFWLSKNWCECKKCIVRRRIFLVDKIIENM